MKTGEALKALAALGQETRLLAFRLLVRRGPDGLPAGEIGRRLSVPGPTLSVHLAKLEAAGLVRARRVQRQIIYAADYGGMSGLLTYLAEDCCQNRDEICRPAFAALAG